MDRRPALPRSRTWQTLGAQTLTSRVVVFKRPLQHDLETASLPSMKSSDWLSFGATGVSLGHDLWAIRRDWRTIRLVDHACGSARTWSMSCCAFCISAASTLRGHAGPSGSRSSSAGCATPAPRVRARRRADERRVRQLASVGVGDSSMRSRRSGLDVAAHVAPGWFRDSSGS